MNLDEVADRIRKVRREKRFSASEVARNAGIDPSLLSRLENHRLPEIGFVKLSRTLEQVGLQFVIVPKTPLPTLLDMADDVDD